MLTVSDYEFIVKLQIEELGHSASSVNVMIEPQPKNTLPAIYNAVMTIRETSGDDTVAVMTSDHLISSTEDLFSKIKLGAAIADKHIFTFGISPVAPETGFGYIKPGEALSVGYKIDEFKEKPDAETA